MEEKFKYVESLIESAEAYGKTSIELVKLKTVDKVADGVSSFVAWTAFVIALILCFTILNFGLALWIGDMLDKVYMGFLLLRGFMLLWEFYYLFIATNG